MRGYVAALAGLGLLLPLPAQAQTPPIGSSGNAFLDRCGEDPREPCRAYVSGLVDGVMAAGVAMKSNLLCPPPGVTTSQVHDIVVAYIRDNPTTRHLRTDQLAYSALTRAFPCPVEAPVKRKAARKKR